MSSKQDLMDYINNQDDCSIVKTTYVETKPDGSKRYRFSVCKEGVDSAIFENKEIYVWDEGEPNEKALWLGRKPYVVSDTSESFVNRLHTFIQSKINDNSIQAAFVDNADEKTKRAVCSTIINDIEIKILIYDDEGTISYKVLS